MIFQTVERYVFISDRGKKNANILFDLFDYADLFITFFSSKSNREQTIYMYVNVSPSILSFKGAELSPVTSSLFNNFSRVVRVDCDRFSGNIILMLRIHGRTGSRLPDW